MLNLPEVLVANGTGIIMIVFLLLVRIQRYSREYTAQRLFNAILACTLGGLIFETISFLVDGKTFPGSVFLLYLSNTMCTGLTAAVGFFWCMFVNFHIYHSKKRLLKQAVWVSIPLVVLYLLLIINLFGNGIIFQIYEDGVYARGTLNSLVYIVLVFYFCVSAAEVSISQRRGINLLFFPVYYFTVPCIVGAIIQGLCYGLATGWVSTAMACLFVSIELDASNSFLDSMSGLFNREYMNYYLNRASRTGAELYGIMMDINDFKSINDRFGHMVGDRAIAKMGEILSRSVSNGAVAMRMSGDEFVVFINNGNEQKLESQKEQIEAALARFNQSGTAPYRLTISTGTAALTGKTVEQFLTEMDRAMYEAKRVYHKGRYGPPEDMPEAK